MPRIGDKLTFGLIRAATVLAAATMLTASASAQQRPVDANTAASIVENQPASASVAPASLSIKPDPAPAIVVPPASESRTLGRAEISERAEPIGTGTQGPDGERVPPSDSSQLGAIGAQSIQWTRVLGALAAVVGLILLARTLAVRFLPSFAGARTDRPSGVIEVLARYPIGRGQQLLVLKFARRILLVHQAGTVARTLSEMSDPDEVAATLSRLEAGAAAGSAGRFREALKTFEREHEAVLAARSRAGASLAAETEIIDLTRTQFRGIGGVPMRRALR